MLAAALSGPALRRLAEVPSPARPCPAEGRGVPPRHWLGCTTDGGPRRGLAGDERLLLGLPLDPNAASARELSFVPGLSRRLAEEIVADRAENGPFAAVDDLERVRGIGPRRLARARPHLSLDAP